MNANDFLAALAPALTDADARAQFLANPREALAAAGLAMPDWVQVSATEGTAPELTITLPPTLDPDAELSEGDLVAVSGGCLPQVPDDDPSYGM